MSRTTNRDPGPLMNNPSGTITSTTTVSRFDTRVNLGAANSTSPPPHILITPGSDVVSLESSGDPRSEDVELETLSKLATDSSQDTCIDVITATQRGAGRWTFGSHWGLEGGGLVTPRVFVAG